MHERTPWPIELSDHPLGSCRKEETPPNTGESLEEEGSCEGLSPEQITTACFEKPRDYREMILREVRVESLEKFEGGSTFYMWLNKSCPVGCPFCFFRSPTKAEKNSETEITDPGIDKIIKLSQDAKLDKFVISGGGEPIMSREKVYKLAREVKTDHLVIVTSAFWTRNPETTNDILTRLRESTQENPNEPVTQVRLSLDKDHFGRLCKGKGFQYVKNLIDWFSNNAVGDEKFKLLIHTMEGDNTVEELLAELPTTSIERTEKYLNRKTKVTLENGLVFDIEYSQIFDSNPNVDLHDEKKKQQNETTFREFIEERRKGNMSLSFHEDEQEKGVFFLLLYDGTTTIWGASAPEDEASLCKEDYRAIMEKNLRDVITMSSLEKGPFYIQRIVSEVNPQAVDRAIGVGLRDFYARLLLEEDKTRLYLSVRLMQDLIAEGRIPEDQVKAWPAKLQTMVGLSKEQLQKIYRESNFNIVDQYFRDPALSTEKLLLLYNRVQLGHYALTPSEMIDQVKSSSIDPDIRDAFLDSVTQHEPVDIS